MKVITILNILLVSLISLGMLAGCASDDTPQSELQPEGDAEITPEPRTEETSNTLTQQEIDEGWILLFDGESTSGWRGYNQDSMPGAWVIEDESLKFDSNSSEDGGDILYDEEFQNFHLSLEWKVAESGNSGIFYLAQELDNTPIWHSAPEFQILDNENHPDANRGLNNNRKSASLYDLLPAEPQNANPFGEWNKAEILVNNGNVVHFQNGEPVVEFQIGTPEWIEMVANSKFSDIEHFAAYDTGYIALQDHGDDVWFRNIKLRVIH